VFIRVHPWFKIPRPVRLPLQNPVIVQQMRLSPANETELAFHSMRIKPSSQRGHVLFDLDEAGIRLLAKETLPASAAGGSDTETLWAEVDSRATRLLQIENGGAGWRSFGIND
jgi:hypothetical protein